MVIDFSAEGFHSSTRDAVGLAGIGEHAVELVVRIDAHLPLEILEPHRELGRDHRLGELGLGAGQEPLDQGLLLELLELVREPLLEVGAEIGLEVVEGLVLLGDVLGELVVEGGKLLLLDFGRPYWRA